MYSMYLPQFGQDASLRRTARPVQIVAVIPTMAVHDLRLADRTVRTILK